MSLAILCLGTNLGNRQENLKRALKELEKQGDIVKKSRIYETEPYGVFDQPDFLNIVIGYETALSPHELLSFIKKIEKNMGRTPGRRWGERIIDIDILFYENLILDEPDLKIPHPEIEYRKFVLEPLSEIYPDLVHPVKRTNIRLLLRKLHNLPYVSSVETPKGKFYFSVKDGEIWETSFSEIKGRQEKEPLLLKLREDLRNYFNSQKVDFSDYKLRRNSITDFQWKIYSTLRKCVKWGETISYSELAALAGRPEALRAVGQAMAKNPFPVIVPCHRVLRKNGKIGGFSGGIEWKKFLLNIEGHNYL